MSTSTTIESFQADVIDASMQVPVLVDFWAEWCGPCKALGPVLEKLEKDYAGRFKLVKIDTEAQQQLAAHFQIRSIPTVFAFVRGQPVDRFQGVLPEGRIREFIDKLMPDPAELELDQADAAMARGDQAAAAGHVRRAIELDPSNDAARLVYAQLLMADGDPKAAKGQTDALSATARRDPQVDGLVRQIEAAVEQARTNAPVELVARIDADPADMGARMELAEFWIAHKEWEHAFEQLIEVVSRDRAHGDDAARKRMIEVFEMAGAQPALVSQWRRRLGGVLNVV